MPDKAHLRADHRFIAEILKTSFEEDGPDPRPEELDAVSEIFVKTGGSWRKVFGGGSPDDVHKLKSVIKAALKGRLISKKSKEPKV